jgi:sugar diacid utilization regulator
MEDRDKKLLKAYAENDMSMKKTGGAVYLHYNSIRYRFRLIQRETRLDARKFWDLVKLLEMEES